MRRRAAAVIGVIVVLAGVVLAFRSDVLLGAVLVLAGAALALPPPERGPGDSRPDDGGAGGGL